MRVRAVIILDEAADDLESGRRFYNEREAGVGRDFRLETSFVGGKMKHRRIPLIDGMEVDAFLLAHADESILIQDGYEHLVSRRQEMLEAEPDDEE